MLSKHATTKLQSQPVVTPFSWSSNMRYDPKDNDLEYMHICH